MTDKGGFSILKVVTMSMVIGVSASPVSAGDKTLNINSGDSKSAVIEALGEPEDRQFEGSNEAWQYCTTGFANGKYSVIFFANGLVTSIKKYSRGLGPASPCERRFATVTWGEKPDVVLGVKK